MKKMIIIAACLSAVALAGCKGHSNPATGGGSTPTPVKPILSGKMVLNNLQFGYDSHGKKLAPPTPADLNNACVKNSATIKAKYPHVNTTTIKWDNATQQYDDTKNLITEVGCQFQYTTS